MAMTVPALQGKMGNVTFYETKMRAREVIAIARPASEREEWAGLGVNERLQRELNEKRVRDEIIPYLTKLPDRFFGSLLILVNKPELFDYESADKYLAKDVPAAYRKTLQQMGTLTIDGGELIVLDGQHRWAALRAIVQDASITGEFVGDVPNDELIVVFIEHTSDETTRRIFNKINKHAKPTGRSDNIITSEDDGNAILARRLLDTNEPLGGVYINKEGTKELLVNWRSTTISTRSSQWTTISAVHQTVLDILKHHNIEFDEKERVSRPSDDELDDAYDHVQDWWTAVLNGVVAFETVLDTPNAVPQLRKDHPEWALLLKPAVHIVIFKALIKAVDRGATREEAISRLNRLDWNTSASLWRNILITGQDRIVARSENYDITSEVIGYLIGGVSNGVKVRDALQTRVIVFRGEDESEYALPNPLD